MTGKVLPVDFGSSEESAQALLFVVGLPGLAGAAAAQVAALALLAARHIEKCGRKPVLDEAAKLLAREEHSRAVLGRIARADIGALTKATRAFLTTAVEALMREDDREIRQAVDNAACVLMREHLKRQGAAEPCDDEPQGAAVSPVPVIADDAEVVKEARGSYIP